MGFICVLEADSFHCCTVNIPPQFCYHWVCLSPSIYQGWQFLFGKSHLQSTHSFQRADRAAITEGKFCDFAFLPKVSVDAVLFYGNTEHL